MSFQRNLFSFFFFAVNKLLFQSFFTDAEFTRKVVAVSIIKTIKILLFFFFSIFFAWAAAIDGFGKKVCSINSLAMQLKNWKKKLFRWFITLIGGALMALRLMAQIIREMTLRKESVFAQETLEWFFLYEILIIVMRLLNRVLVGRLKIELKYMSYDSI